MLLSSHASASVETRRGCGPDASAAGRAGDNSAALAGDSSVNAVLTKPGDSRRSKSGDPVNARTTQPARTADGRSILKGRALARHVSEDVRSRRVPG
jgi:hypothetical protein